MEIIIKGTVEKDFPNLKGKNEEFIAKMGESVRRRLELRPEDKVIFDIKGLN